MEKLDKKDAENVSGGSADDMEARPSIRIHLLYFRDMLRFMVLTIIRDTAPVTVRALALVQDMAQVLDLVRDTNKLLPRLSF